MSRPPKIADEDVALFDLPLHRPKTSAAREAPGPETIDTEEEPFGSLVETMPPSEPTADSSGVDPVAAEPTAEDTASHKGEPGGTSAPQISFAMTLPFEDGKATPAAESSEAPATDAEPVRAGFVSRLTAGLIDLGLLGIGLGIAAGGTVLLGVSPRVADWPAFLILGLTFSFLYYVIPLAFWGRSAGMAVRRLFVRSNDGRPLSFRQATQRWLAALVTLATLGLPILLALTPFSLADRLSGSRTFALP